MKHENLHVLAVQPGTQWKTEEVGKAYQKLAEKYGVSMALVIDGAPELRACMGETSSSMGTDVKRRLLEFTQESEKLLDEGQRVPISTEILESSFGLYKQLERQHSKGGFTSLLAAFGSLLRPVTPKTVQRDLARVSVQKMRAWVSQNIGSTLTSKRQNAYREFANAA